MARVPQEDTAFSHRSASYIFNVIARSPEGTRFDGHVDWARATRTALTGDSEPDKVRASYAPATYARLVDVKRRYDPNNMFRLNQNISPNPLIA